MNRLLIIAALCAAGCTDAPPSDLDVSNGAPETTLRVQTSAVDEASPTGEDIVERWVDDPPDADEVTDMLSYASGGCVLPDLASSIEYNECRRAQWFLSEQRLAASEDAYYHKIEDYGLTGYQDMRDEWHTLHTYAKAQWRRHRDAQCASVGFEAQGGSGTGAFIIECIINMNDARVSFLRDGDVM